MATITTDSGTLNQLQAKIQKLLNTNGRTPEEAAMFAAKAQELAFKYNLDLAEIQAAGGEAQPYGRVDYKLGKRWGLMTWRRTLMNNICHANFCRVVLTGQDGVAIIGERHNVEVVKYLFEYLAKELERFVEQDYDPQCGLTSNKFWPSYLTGAAVGVGKQLDAQRAKDTAVSTDCRALVVQKDQEVEAAKNREFPHLGKGTRTTVNAWSAYGAGHKRGSTMDIRAGVRSGPTGAALLS